MFLAAAVLYAFEPERPGRPVAFRAVNLPRSRAPILRVARPLSAKEPCRPPENPLHPKIRRKIRKSGCTIPLFSIILEAEELEKKEEFL